MLNEYTVLFYPILKYFLLLNTSSRMVVELHRKVSSLIEYLKQKWTYHDQRIVSLKTSCAQQLYGAAGLRCRDVM